VVRFVHHDDLGVGSSMRDDLTALACGWMLAIWTGSFGRVGKPAAMMPWSRRSA
jgi:hypothetical protein